MPSLLLERLASTLAARTRITLAPPNRRVAAVLVPLLEVDGALHVLYTRRATTLSHHQGQVAFPGGTRDPGDRDLAVTALRESHEEIGLAPDDVHLLGTLDDIETMSSRFVITPFVGLAPYPYDWRPAPDEVEAIFTVPIATLAAPDAERSELWELEGRSVPIRLFPVGDQTIWGATHRITRNLLEVIATLS
ncbi:MAG TPA: CoA pyrophosphatase [Candidatus Binatia bacterium]|jgi:8-oxo-dGTP pyrophosphatase MutT (NUDIX family)|nr:CoA pyrophosphatase [Candidatus Binatia bacterium]